VIEFGVKLRNMGEEMLKKLQNAYGTKVMSSATVF
jgi:hypothetical protein